MAKGKEVKNWITINGAHVPIYADGSMGGIGAKLQGKQGSSKNDISEKEDQKQLDDIEAKRNKMYSIIKKVQKEYGDDDDGFAEDIMSDIIEDNGHDLSDDEIRELASQYYEDEDEDWQDRVGDDQEEYYEDEDDPNVIARNNADAKLDEIAERYNTSKPVSGDWDTEVAHEQAAIAEELGISEEEAKQLMKDKLGFTDDQFDDDKKEDFVVDYKIPDDPEYAAKQEAKRKAMELGDEVDAYDRQHKEGKYAEDEDLPFQDKGLSREEKAEDWSRETQKDIAAKKANIKEMGYAEAGQFISDHKEEFGLSDDDDAYQIAAQIKNGDIKLDKNGKVSKADRDKVSEGSKAMDKAAKERGDYVEADDIDLSEYEYVANQNGYQTYRKIENGKGVWVAQDQDGKNPPFSISYDQALGYEPIITTNAEALSHEVGQKLFGKRSKEKAANDGKIKANMPVSKDKGSSTSQEILRLRDDLNAGKTVTTTNKEVADMYAANQNPNFKFTVEDQGDGSYKISAKKAKAAGSQKKVKVGGREVSVSKEAPVAEGRVKDSKNTLAEREGKSINVGGKKVGVNKEKAGETDRERAQRYKDEARKQHIEYQRKQAEKYPSHLSAHGEAIANPYAQLSNLKGISLTGLKVLAEDVGISKNAMKGMSAAELRKQILSAYKRIGINL